MSAEKVKTLFSGLGKPTLRGVRRCPKCGTFNGTRGLVCKNTSCDVVFKLSGAKKKLKTDACRVMTKDSSSQIYSVRVRDKGPDYRSFVVLPQPSLECEGLDSQLEYYPTCYVDNCQKRNGYSQPKSFSREAFDCLHVKSAMSCIQVARPLSVKTEVLRNLCISEAMKQAIINLNSDNSGPLVQRVSKHVMVVKCKKSSKAPLGFIHFFFFDYGKRRNSSDLECTPRFFCGCKNLEKSVDSIEETLQKRCIHFYSCVCAFSSDKKLTEEFQFFIQSNNLHVFNQSLNTEKHFVSLMTEVDEDFDTDCQDKGVISNTDLLDSSNLSNDSLNLDTTPMIDLTRPVNSLEELPCPETAATLIFDNGVLLHNIPPKRKMDGPTLFVSSTKRDRTTPKRLFTFEKYLDEKNIALGFSDWMAGITERINCSMHYQENGRPTPLVYFIPQTYFDCFRERINYGSKKKRLPNCVVSFQRDKPPFGLHTRYTWNLTNISLVKNIFDTSLVKLDLSRSFLANRDGTYSQMWWKDDYENSSATHCTNRKPIKPQEFKTFLKIGTAKPGDKCPSAMKIDWIPNVYPITQTGELTISYEFGHEKIDRS